jgi:hypothetical protein
MSLLDKARIFILHSSGDMTLHSMALKSALNLSGLIVNAHSIDFKNEYAIPNMGFTKNWNRIIHEFVLDNPNPDFEYIGLFNDDIDISKEAVEKVIEFLDEHQRCAMASAAFNTDVPFQIPNHIRRDLGYSIRPVVEFTAPIFRVSALKAIGAFDERFSLGWGVDYDWCYRSRRMGYSIAVVESVSFYHYQHSSINKVGRKDYFSRASNEMEKGLTEKYGENWYSKIRTMVGLTMVVRNEMKNLPKMLQDLQHSGYLPALVDEIAIGVEPSDDGTLEFCRENADTVIELEDVGYCEYHRGLISYYCLSDVQLCLDADEYLDIDFQIEFQDLILELSETKLGYRLMRSHYIDNEFRYQGDVQYRIYHRDAVKFIQQLHTEPQPTFKDVPLHNCKPAIYHMKTLDEQLEDEMRYQEILKKEEKFKKHPLRQRLWEISSVYTGNELPDELK